MKPRSDFWDRAKIAADSLEKLRARQHGQLQARKPPGAVRLPNGFDDQLSSRPDAELTQEDKAATD